MANAIEAGRAFMRLYLDDNSFRRGLDVASKRLTSFGKSVAGLGFSIARLGAGLASPFALAVKAASDAEETFSKFGVVFGDAADGVRQWGDELADQVGRSKTEVAGFLAGFQDLLVPIGIDPKAAEETSKSLTALAFDLASFNNMADADVVRDLSAALTGSGEVMKKYGVIVSEAAVKQELLGKGIDPKDVTEADKAFARFSIILRGTTAAQGDAVRTADGFANSMRSLWSAAKDTAAAIGRPLLDPLARFARYIADGAKSIGEFVSENEGLVRVIAAVAVGVVAVGSALVLIGGGIVAAGAVLASLSAILSTLGAVAGAVVSPIGLAVAAVAGLGVALVKYTSIGAKAIEFLRDQFGGLLEPIKSTIAGVRDAIAAGELKLAGEVLMAGLRASIAAGAAKIQEIWSTLQSFLVGVFYDAVSGIVMAISSIESAWARAVGGMRKEWLELNSGFRVLWIKTVATINGESPRATLGKLAEVLKDNSTQTAAIERETAAAIERVSALRDGALAAIDETEKSRKAEILAAVNQAIAARDEARSKLDEAVSQASAAAGAEASDGAGRSMEDRFAGMIEDAKAGLAKASEGESRGTFSSQAINAQLAPSNSIDKEQLEELKKVAAGVDKVAKNTKFGGVIPVGN